MPPRFRFLLSPFFWCLLAFLLRFFYLIEQSNHSVLFAEQTLDELELARSAEQLVRGEGFGAEPLFKAPLYPVFLAACMKVGGDSWFWLVRFMQHLGGVALVWLAYDTARRLMPGEETRQRVAGTVAAAVVTFYAPLIRLENRLVMDFLGTLLQSAMMWALIRELMEERKPWRMRWLLVAGFFAGLSWLTRPTITPVLPLLGLLTAWLGRDVAEGRWKSRLLRLGYLLLLPLIMMGGVVIRNASVGGEAMLLPWQGGYNLYHANRPEANGRYYIQDGFSAADSGNPTRDLMIQGVQQAIRAGDLPPPPDGRLAGAVDAFWMARAKGVIFEDVPGWLVKMIQKGVYLTSAREIFNFEAFEIHQSESVILRWMPMGFGLLWPFALMSLLLPWKGGPAWQKAFWLMWGYLVLMGGAIALVYTSGRLRMPLVFPVVVCASMSLTLLGGWIQQRCLPQTGIRVWGAFLLMALGAGMSWGDWWGVRSEGVAHFDYARMSDAAWRQNRFAEALEYAEQAEALSPDYLPLPLLKAQALFSLQRIDEAEQAFQEALERMPKDPTPAFNLGFLWYYERSHPERALSFFTEAVRRNPAADEPWIFIAMCHIRLGGLPEAREGLSRSTGASSSLRYRIAHVALLRKEGQAEEAAQAMEEWFRPIPPEVLEQVQDELRLLLTPPGPP